MAMSIDVLRIQSFVGILDAFREIQITPKQNEFGRIVFQLDGDVDALMDRLYRNEPVGALDALKAIKAARQAIFTLRDNPKGEREKKVEVYRSGNRR